MEEKERYTIESFEIDEPSCIFDNKTQQRILTLVEYNYDEIVNLENLLNQQDKENQQLKQELKDERAELQQLYSHLEVEAFGEDIQEQAVKEIDKIKEENKQLKQQLAESEKEIESIQVLLSENAIDRKAMQEFKIGEDEYDLTDEDARNSLCWEVEELKQQLDDLPKKIVEDCKMALIKRINIISGYGRMTIDEQSFFFENEYGKDLETILKKYGGEDE